MERAALDVVHEAVKARAPISTQVIKDLERVKVQLERNMAIKADIAELRGKLVSNVSELRGEFTSSISGLRAA